MMHIAVLALAVAINARSGTQEASRAAAGPPLNGTFVQFHVGDEWTEARLKQLLVTAQQVGLSSIVVQWTVVGTRAFYPSREFEPIPAPPLEPLLALADQYGMKVRVGLVHDLEFWDRIKLKEPTSDVESYLRRLGRRSTKAARELLPIVSRHRSFDGWFISEEIDDVNWLLPERRAILQTYLSALRQSLWRIGSSESVAVSGFSNAHCDPSTLELFWRELMTETAIDALFFQDGIGTHKLGLPYLPLYLDAMKRAATAAGGTLSVVVELFDQVGGSPITEGPFKAVPAPIERIARQIALAEKASTGGTLAFSVPDYMTPTAGTDAEHLFTEYVMRYCSEESGIPCPSVTAETAREVLWSRDPIPSFEGAGSPPSSAEGRAVVAPADEGRAVVAHADEGRADVAPVPAQPLRVNPRDDRDGSLVPRPESRVRRPGAVVYDSRDSDVRPPVETRPHVPSEVPAGVDRSQVVVFELVIDETGRVESVRLLQSLKRWDHVMLMSSIKAWQFQPATKDGEPVKFRQQVRVWAPAY